MMVRRALLLPLLAMLVAAASGAAAFAADAPHAAAPAAAPGPAITEVRVERIKPQKEKHATLRFLKENRDFIRARFDLLRQLPLARTGAAEEIDPRWLSYQDMLNKILAARDSTSAAQDAWRRQELIESIAHLGDLEVQLDLMERLLAAQRTRLGLLQEDFTGRQETALVVVLSGWPSHLSLSQVTITLEDGDTLTVPITPEQRASLERGGVMEVVHKFVEPREQVVEVALTGDAWPAGDTGFVTLEPARDRITLLRLDLSAIQPDRGAASIRASTWLHEARILASEG